MHQVRFLALTPFLVCGTLAAQTPFEPLSDLWVTDSSNDRIARVRDLNYDGDYDDAGEVVVFYDDNLGPYQLSNNACIYSFANESILVGDTTQDFILLMRDLNGDGDANDSGETTEFFTSLANVPGIEMQSIGGIAVAGNVVYAAVSQAGSTGKDFILRLEDLDNDGDANDAGEASEYFVRADMAIPGTTTADSLCQDVEVGNDGNVYYLEICSNGLYAKGIYKLVDLNSNGVIDPPGEVSPFFIPPAQTAAAFHWAIEQNAAGDWFVQDTGNDFIWRARDANSNGVIDPATEAVKYWISPAASLVWDAHWSADGKLYVGEAQSTDRIFVMKDANSNDMIDVPSEVTTPYNESVALGAAIGQIRDFALDGKWQAPSKTYCTPQINTLGCATAMSYSGWPSATHGSGYYLTASNVRNQKSGLMFYGLSGPQATPFNGGTMCVAGPRIRTPIQTSGGTSVGDDCTGTFSVDFNAYIVSGVNPALIAGVVVDAQYWSRDPGSLPGNTNLSDAVEFEILR